MIFLHGADVNFHDENSLSTPRSVIQSPPWFHRSISGLKAITRLTHALASYPLDTHSKCFPNGIFCSTGHFDAQMSPRCPCIIISTGFVCVHIHISQCTLRLSKMYFIMYEIANSSHLLCTIKSFFLWGND